MNEYVFYGGAVVTRGEMISHLQRTVGASGASAYLSGHRSPYSEDVLREAYYSPQNVALRREVLA